ncbi:MAG: hypothetical protein WEE89_13940 [Gemmatimonadota bacterium]
MQGPSKAQQQQGHQGVATSTGSRWGALLVLMLILAIPPASAHAGEGLTCGWCGEFTDDFENTIHGFPNGGDECGWPAPDPIEGESYSCARCGGSSSCHQTAQNGGCHIECGPGGGNGNGNGGGGGNNYALTGPDDALNLGAQDVATLLANAVVANDAGQILTFTRANTRAFRVAIDPDGGRLEVFASCDQVTPAAIIPIPAELRRRVARQAVT